MAEQAGGGGQEPKGELTLRTLAMPANTNASGDIFGGWIMSLMDLAGGMKRQQAPRELRASS